ARRMPHRPDVRPAHRSYKSFEVAHSRVPAILAVGRHRTVAMAALIVAVNMTDRAQPLCKRPADAPEKSSRVQDHDRRAISAPVQRMQSDAVDVHEAAARFGFFHVPGLRGPRSQRIHWLALLSIAAVS